MARENKKAAPEKPKHTWSGSQGAWANAWCDPSRDDARDPRPPSAVEKLENSEPSGDDLYE